MTEKNGRRTPTPKFSALESRPTADMLAAMLLAHAERIDSSTHAGAVERKLAIDWATELADKFGSGPIELSDRAPSYATGNGYASGSPVQGTDELPVR